MSTEYFVVPAYMAAPCMATQKVVGRQTTSIANLRTPDRARSCLLLKRLTSIALLALLATRGSLTVRAADKSPAAGGAGAPTATVQWLEPIRPTLAPKTEEETKTGVQSGRALPKPELLQPTLDPALPAYVPRKDVELAGDFKAAASDLLPGLVKLWVGAFRKYYPRVNIDVSPPYEAGLGAKELIKEKLDFVFVSRELKPDDVSEFQAKFGYPPLSVPICGGSYRHFRFLDAVGFLVHKDNPLERISYDQLDAILSSTHHRGGQAITTWGELGITGEWADKPVHVYGIKPWNGFEEFVRQRVLSRGDRRGQWRTGILFSDVVYPIARRIADDRYGIGYTGLAYIDAPVKVLAVGENAGGPYYAPTYENVARAAYPLARLIYFNTNKAPGKPVNPAIDEFLRFVLSKEGQQLVLDQAVYLPLRATQAEASRALLGR